MEFDKAIQLDPRQKACRVYSFFPNFCKYQLNLELELECIDILSSNTRSLAKGSLTLLLG